MSHASEGTATRWKKTEPSMTGEEITLAAHTHNICIFWVCFYTVHQHKELHVCVCERERLCVWGGVCVSILNREIGIISLNISIFCFPKDIIRRLIKGKLSIELKPL